MKKILLMLVLVCCMLTLVGCETGNFLNTGYEAEYYKETESGFVSEKTSLSTIETTELKAYHTLTFTTNSEIDIKKKDIIYIVGSFEYNCVKETKFHIQLKWSQGFWYKDKIFVDEYYTVKPEEDTFSYEIDLYDKDLEVKGFKIPSNNDATITLSISAFVDDVEVKDYEIAFKSIEFMVDDHNENVPEDESLKQDTEETKTE